MRRKIYLLFVAVITMTSLFAGSGKTEQKSPIVETIESFYTALDAGGFSELGEYIHPTASLEEFSIMGEVNSLYCDRLISLGVCPFQGGEWTPSEGEQWAETSGKAGQINMEAVDEALKKSENVPGFEKRVNEIYMGDEMVLIEVKNQGREQLVSGYADLNDNSQIDQDKDEKLFTFRRWYDGDNPRYETRGYGVNSYYHHVYPPGTNLLTTYLLISALSRHSAPGYYYSTIPRHVGVMRNHRTNYRQTPSYRNQVDANGSFQARMSIKHGTTYKKASPSASRRRWAVRKGVNLNKITRISKSIISQSLGGSKAKTKKTEILESFYKAGVYVDLLFSIALGTQTDLDNGAISGDLRQEFRNNRISLSQNAAVSIEETGSRWLIADENKTYIVRKGEDELNIYHAPEKRIDEGTLRGLDGCIEKLEVKEESIKGTLGRKSIAVKVTIRSDMKERSRAELERIKEAIEGEASLSANQLANVPCHALLVYFPEDQEIHLKSHSGKWKIVDIASAR